MKCKLALKIRKLKTWLVLVSNRTGMVNAMRANGKETKKQCEESEGV